jgi:2-polyprenyl-6-methoxyphenol hydroxylase-like FAD-dependent oxidoreductase
MTNQLQVAIVGYGIGGIAAAVQLRRLGHCITHFDRNDPPAALGGGMLLHPPALRQLRSLGVLDAVIACGAPVKRICARTVRGQMLMDLDYAKLVGDQHGLGIQRGTLHRLLSGADTGRNGVLGGHNIASVDLQGGYVSQDSGRRHGPYDLIVVADGAHSALREQIPVFARRNKCADIVALVGLLDDPDQFAGHCLVQHFDGARHLSVWPVGSEYPGGSRRCAVAINVSPEEAETLRDRVFRRHYMMRLCHGIGGILEGHTDNEDMHVFRYRDVELSTCVAGRAVLIGDAAHSMSPQLGVGAQLAMEDASVLAEKLAAHSDVPAALRAYEIDRWMQVTRYQQASRWLTPLLQSDSRLLAGIRDRLLASTKNAPLVKRFAQDLLC